ncbi:hypothetical protein SERLA73DRAFT_186914 [Serpula lacrymans var. lacrymans S7.3]|uniref:Uncharacterized protein n=1 Tax=Serpula lacrymans var. lacrymans (strain S7.3) TaxID=936435 RepID=F8Q838_SERL3|nr:hypothetical protein SERLA73DRAFT_186914 [Serpula lacrymans var. lacrymans S7.3]
MRQDRECQGDLRNQSPRSIRLLSTDSHNDPRSTRYDRDHFIPEIPEEKMETRNTPVAHCDLCLLRKFVP